MDIKEFIQSYREAFGSNIAALSDYSTRRFAHT